MSLPESKERASRPRLGTGRRKAWWLAASCGAATAVLGMIAAGPALMHWDRVQDYLDVEADEPHDWPERTNGNLRQVLLRSRDHAMARGDLDAVALIHADLGQEALLRAAAVHDAWMSRRHQTTHLFPRGPKSPVWNYRDTAADCFGFLLQSGVRLRPGSLPALHVTLQAEDSLEPDGALCQPVDFATAEPVRADAQERMFASSEYVKDGLISVYERFGGGMVGPRMFEVLDAVLANATHASKFGPIAGAGSEVNGNVLQVCSRLSFSADTPTRQAAYAAMAARTADAVTQQMLPACNGLPVRTFNYETGQPVETHIKFRDHGNEVLPGLAEAYAMAIARRAEDPEWGRRADRWAEPIARLFELVLEKGRGPDGVLISGIDTATFAVTDARPCDNWGYVLSGVLLFTKSAREHGTIAPARLDALDAGVDRMAAAVTRLRGASWEGDGMDGYCDTLESALYIARHRPSQAAVLLPWVDDQVGLLLDRQRDDGFVGGNYLDGNFIRTALMYADQKAGGWRVEPFRADVRVGYSQSPANGAAVLTVASDLPYQGRLVPDTARHHDIMRLPWDWPRLNSWPEWSAANTQRVTHLSDHSGIRNDDDLRDGLTLNLPEHGLAVIQLEAVGERTTNLKREDAKARRTAAKESESNAQFRAIASVP